LNLQTILSDIHPKARRKKQTTLIEATANYVNDVTSNAFFEKNPRIKAARGKRKTIR
jgi:hypothetical protein